MTPSTWIKRTQSWQGHLECLVLGCQEDPSILLPTGVRCPRQCECPRHALCCPLCRPLSLKKSPQFLTSPPWPMFPSHCFGPSVSLCSSQSTDKEHTTLSLTGGVWKNRPSGLTAHSGTTLRAWNSWGALLTNFSWLRSMKHPNY